MRMVYGLLLCTCFACRFITTHTVVLLMIGFDTQQTNKDRFRKLAGPRATYQGLTFAKRD